MARKKKETGGKAQFNADDNPGKPGIAHERQSRALRIVRDVDQGTLRLRDQGTEYLMQFPKETPKRYSERLNQSVLFNAFARTVDGLTGMVFRKDPEPSDAVPEAIRADLNNIDMAGRDLPTFGRDHFRDALTDGHAGILVDMQQVEDGEFASLLEERNALRPYWVSVRKGDIIRFRTRTVAGRIILTHLAFRVTTTEAVGSYGEQQVTRVREFNLVVEANEGGELQPVVRWQTWRQLKEGDHSSWTSEEEGILDGMDRIPFVATYTGRCGYLDSEPPLVDLAMENIKHWQKRSDRDNVEHVACCPIFVLIGVDEDPDALEIGPTVAVRLPQGGDAKYAEPQGQALPEGRQSLEDIERRMAILGLSQLMSETRAAETATSKRIDKSESDSKLAAAARSLQKSLGAALRLHAQWRGLNIPDDAGVAVNMDFEDLAMEPAMVRELAALVPEKLSAETLWELLQRGEILLETFSPEEERRRIDSVGEDELRRTAAALKAMRGSPEDDEEDDEAA